MVLYRVLGCLYRRLTGPFFFVFWCAAVVFYNAYIRRARFLRSLGAAYTILYINRSTLGIGRWISAYAVHSLDPYFSPTKTEIYYAEKQ